MITYFSLETQNFQRHIRLCEHDFEFRSKLKINYKSEYLRIVPLFSNPVKR